jgi:hypothetical protein
MTSISKPWTARRSSKWTALQNQPEAARQEPTGLSRAYPGLQHHDPEAGVRAALLVEQGYGRIDWGDEQAVQVALFDAA